MTDQYIDVASTINDQFDVSFDFVRFIKFLKDHNIIATAIAAVLSDRINEVTNAFVNNLIMPVINRDADNDGTKDIQKLEDKVVSFKGVKLEIGRFFLAIFKFIVVTYLIFIISRALKKLY